jgi:hypothetical protein
LEINQVGVELAQLDVAMNISSLTVVAPAVPPPRAPLDALQSLRPNILFGNLEFFVEAVRVLIDCRYRALGQFASIPDAR